MVQRFSISETLFLLTKPNIGNNMPNNEDLVAFCGDKNDVSHSCFKLGHRVLSL